MSDYQDHPAIVTIADVMPDAVEITASEVRPTDRVYDAMGGTHAITRLRKRKRVVTFRRDDLDADESFEAGAVITVERN